MGQRLVWCAGEERFGLVQWFSLPVKADFLVQRFMEFVLVELYARQKLGVEIIVLCCRLFC